MVTVSGGWREESNVLRGLVGLKGSAIILPSRIGPSSWKVKFGARR